MTRFDSSALDLASLSPRQASAELSLAAADGQWGRAMACLPKASQKARNAAVEVAVHLASSFGNSSSWARLVDEPGSEAALAFLLAALAYPTPPAIRNALIEELCGAPRATECLRLALAPGGVKARLKTADGVDAFIHAAKNRAWANAEILLDHGQCRASPELYPFYSDISGAGQRSLLQKMWAILPASEWQLRDAIPSALRENHDDVARWLLAQVRMGNQDLFGHGGMKDDLLRASIGFAMKHPPEGSFFEQNENRRADILNIFLDAWGDFKACGPRLLGQLAQQCRLPSNMPQNPEHQKALSQKMSSLMESLRPHGAWDADSGAQALAACVSSNEPLAFWLIENGALTPLTSPAMRRAASAGLLAPVRFLQKNGARIDADEELLGFAANVRGATRPDGSREPVDLFFLELLALPQTPRALNWAAAAASGLGRIDHMQLLLDAGLDIHQPWEAPATLKVQEPLIASLSSPFGPQVEMVDWLLKRGCSAKGSANDGAPLKTALENKNWGAAALILAAGGATRGALPALREALGESGDAHQGFFHAANEALSRAERDALAREVKKTTNSLGEPQNGRSKAIAAPFTKAISRRL